MKTNQKLQFILQKYVLIFFLTIASSLCAKNIYVSKNGNDNNPGTQSKPYKTIAKASSVAQAGDVVIIGGGTYEELLRPVRSGTAGNPIIYRSKAGEKVIITAMQAVNNWSKDQGKIYKAQVTWDLGQDNMTLHNDKLMDLARWPNNVTQNLFKRDYLPACNRGAAGGGKTWLNYNGSQSNGHATSIPHAGKWQNGGSIHFYGGAGFLAWTDYVTNSSSNRIDFKLQRAQNWIQLRHNPGYTGHGIKKGEFFLQGIKEALDYKNEWFYDKRNKTLYVQIEGGGSPANNSIRFRRRTQTINLNKNYIHIEGIAVFGGSIDISGNNNKLYAVSSFYGNHTLGVINGFDSRRQSVLITGNKNLIEKCEIAWGAGNGVYDKGDDNRLLNSYVHDFNYLGNYDCVLNTRGAKRGKYRNNTLTRAGKDVIQAYVDGGEFAYNDISNNNFIADDGGLLYTTNARAAKSSIHHNTFHDSKARTGRFKGAGIYLDNDSKNWDVHHNVVWNTKWTNIQINWDGTNLNIFNNTFAKGSATMGAWHKPGTQFSNVKVWNNITDKEATDQDGNQETESTWEPQSDKQNNLVSRNSFKNYNNNDYTLKSGAQAIDYGRVISGYTDGYQGNKPDVGAYEFGVPPFRTGINWNSDLGPTGNGCYGLPGEGCNVSTTPDEVTFVNPATTIQPQTSYDFKVNYSASTNREIVVEFWSSTGWLGQQMVSVNAGTGTTNVTVDLASAPTPGTGYIYKAHIRPVGTTWQEAIDRDQVENVTVANQTFADKVSFSNAPTTIVQATSYSFDINYEASATRDIIVEFWSSTGWIAQQNVQVAKGIGTKTITVSLPNLPPPGNGYVYKVHIRPLNTSWQDAIDRDQVNNVTVSTRFTQLIPNGIYYIESPQNNERLLARALESHSARMHKPANFDDQKWEIKHISDNSYTIKNLGTNRYLEVPYARCENGTNVATWTDDVDSHKKWKIVKNGNDIYGVKPMHCLSRALDRAGGVVGANATIWDYNNTNANQKWKILSVGNRQDPTSDDSVLTVYPNPSKESITILGVEANDIITIYDLTGKIVKQTKLTTNNKSVNVSDMASGLYVLSVFGKDKVQFVKD
ncbi:T9SS type A sorting domain-containing protein [Aquimarina latercula]|uniref:T9SS type A sorting domain-containing protein n=1 Tax=Aquimarina latercula TaxID=987 RepID=UPI0009D70BA9|nr:T9SS type A sorting domain-containing protein [Aquimarina latercula]